MTSPALAAAAATPRPGASLPIILSLSFCHLLNDTMQSLLPALYPILKDAYALDFAEIGLLTLAFQCTASLLQPAVGLYTDRTPLPYSMAVGMLATLVGLVLLAGAGSYPLLVVAAMLVGCGSAVFHPEASRVARAAAGGRYGLAQSVFQVGGNTGQALGPLLAAFVVVPIGQRGIVWFSGFALLAALILARVGAWHARAHRAPGRAPGRATAAPPPGFPRRQVAVGVAVLVLLIFAKNVYSAALTSYFTFYLIATFGVSVQAAQLFLFAHMAGLAAGLVLGGLVGDRVGRLPVIWFSILGALPFTLALPYANLAWTGVLAVVIGVITASAFSAILVYAQELMPGRVGFVSGMFFGLSFGLGGIAAAALGVLADATSIGTVYRLVSFLPLIGLATALLPRGRT